MPVPQDSVNVHRRTDDRMGPGVALIRVHLRHPRITLYMSSLSASNSVGWAFGGAGAGRPRWA
jgi:hypothetical protein